MDWFLQFVTDFVSQPSIIVGIFVAIGLVVMREKASAAVISVFKTICGFLILSAGVHLTTEVLMDFTTLFSGLFNTGGGIPNINITPSIADHYKEIEMFSSILLVFTFIGNLFLARFTRFKYMFLAGPVLYFLCIAFSSIIFMMGGGFSYDVATDTMSNPNPLIDLNNSGQFVMMLIGAICVMSIYTVTVTSALAKHTAKITGSNGYSASFSGCFTFILSCKIGDAIKKYSKRDVISAEKIKLPRGLQFMSNQVISGTIVMLIIFFALFIPAGIIHDLDPTNGRYFGKSLESMGDKTAIMGSLQNIVDHGWNSAHTPGLNPITISYTITGGATGLSTVVNSVATAKSALATLGQANVLTVSATHLVFVPNGLGSLLTKNNWIIKAFLDAFTFTCGITILMFGVQMITHELVPAFKGFQKCCNGVKPAISVAALLPFAPNSLLMGFLSSIVTGVIGMAITIGIVAGVGGTNDFQPGTLLIIVPFMLTAFFNGGVSGIYGNVNGGYKGAIICGGITGLVSTFLPLIFLAGGWIIDPMITYDHSDFAIGLIPAVIGLIPNSLAAELVFMLLPLAVVIAMLVDGFIYDKTACAVCTVNFKSNDSLHPVTPFDKTDNVEVKNEKKLV